MGKQFDTIEAAHARFIEDQQMFFCASAAPDGRVNVSPKGMDSLRVMGANRIVWVNLTGSGNETAGHLREHARMTLMWCSFTTRPMILRTFGHARTIQPGERDWDALAGHFPAHRSARQLFDLSVDLVQTSCGYGVPFMDYVDERETLQKWVDGKSDAEIRTYWIERNATTLDGKPTGVTGT